MVNLKIARAVLGQRWARELDRIELWLEENERQVRAQKNQAGELKLSINDVIGDFFGGVTFRQVERLLDEAGEISSIRLVINSPGGIVSEGNAIYTTLAQHPATVKAEVVGQAASAASVILMAADERRVATGAEVMIHEAWMCGCGRASDLRQYADELDRINASLVEIYRARTELPAGRIRKMLADETFMSAKEAVELGFADSVIPAKTKPKNEPEGRARDGDSVSVSLETEPPLSAPAPAAARGPITDLVDQRVGTFLSDG